MNDFKIYQDNCRYQQRDGSEKNIGSHMSLSKQSKMSDISGALYFVKI